MAMSIICPCPSQHYGLTHWKYVLRYCDKCPGIITTRQKTNIDVTNTCSPISFHVCRNLSRCNFHGIRPYVERIIFSMCSTYLSYVTPEKVYTRNDLVILEILIS